MKTKSSSSGDRGCVSVLTIIFVVLNFVGLKLTGNIDWSWWWVLSPIWISILFVVALFFLIVFVRWEME